MCDGARSEYSTMPPPSGMAALQYMFDMRHTALGTLGLRPPLGPTHLQHKLALVTGGTGGIGLAAAQAMAAAGATVHIVGRSAERGAAAVNSASGGPGKIIFHRCDLSTVAAARQLDRQLEEDLNGGQLDVLVQNLACMPDKFEAVDGGHERTLSTNLLAFYRLGTALYPRMAKGGRVINVVSAGMHLHKLRVPDLRALSESADAFDPIRAYCITHRARVLLTKRWAAEHPHLWFGSVHPGWVETDGLRGAAAMAGFYALMRRSLRTPEKGADSIAWLLAGGASDVPSGSYVWNRAERKVDLPLSGTKASEAEVDELVEFVRSATL